MIGQTLAHYQIKALLGRGGMGEVYRALDPKLGRDVALKLLPTEFAADNERVARFGREARTLASLSHPNIAQIYGFEQDGEHRFLVMELVEGEDLSERLLRGPIPVDESLEIAEQVARGLESAHEQGVVHRDLKPANVKLTADGQIKLLDFGLARAITGGPEEDPDPANSPTITAAFTQAGTILGTAAYMSPEQARGRPADRRADIWAFGTLLFEMLSGERMFTGETASDTLAAVIKDQPGFERLPSATPPAIVALLERCLEKDPRRRLQSIGEARIAVERERGGDSPTLLSVSHVAGDTLTTAGSRRERIPWALALIAVAALGVFAGTKLATPERQPERRRFLVQPEGLQVSYPTNPALSSDGRRVAYFKGTELRIYDLHHLESTAVEGSDGATSPFWSPDGQWLAFGRGGRIYRVAATGGAPDVVCNVNFASLDGAAWADDGTMILAPDSGPLERVSSSGGDPEPLFPLGRSDSDYHTPSVLPGSSAVLFTTHDADGRETIEIFAEGERKVLLKIPGARLEYATWSPRPGSSTEGHLLYHRLVSNPGVWAVPFTLDGHRVTGEPILLDSTGAYPSLARDGSLLYSSGASTGPLQLVEVDRSGTVVRRVGNASEGMSSLRVSPDGSGVLVEIDLSGNADIWRIDVQRGTHTRMTFGEGAEQDPSWIGDGGQFAYSSVGAGTAGQSWLQSTDGTGRPRELVGGFAVSSVPVSDQIVFVRFNRGGNNGLYRRSIDGSDSMEVFLDTPASEVGPALSPDGRFVVYMSNEAGSNEVFLKPFPSGEGKWQVSIDSGVWPRWNADGSEVIFRSGAGGSARMMAVSVRTDPVVELGAPRVLFSAADAPSLFYGSGYAGYDAIPGSDHLMMYERADMGSVDASLVFIEDWYAAFDVQ